MSDFFLYSDSSTSVTLKPEYNFSDGHKKIESRFRSKSGPEYAYKWADYVFIRFEVKHMSRADATQITSWWLSNTELKFQQGSDDPVDVRITGESSPMSGRSKPYVDQHEGTITLEGF